MDVLSQHYRVYEFQDYAGRWVIGNGPELGEGHAWLSPERCESLDWFVGFIGDENAPTHAIFDKRLQPNIEDE